MVQSGKGHTQYNVGENFSNQWLWTSPPDDQMSTELLQMKSCFLGLFLLLDNLQVGGTQLENHHFTASLGVGGYGALAHSTHILILSNSFLILRRLESKNYIFEFSATTFQTWPRFCKADVCTRLGEQMWAIWGSAWEQTATSGVCSCVRDSSGRDSGAWCPILVTRGVRL